MSPSKRSFKAPVKDRGLLLAILLVTLGGAAAEFLHFGARAREPVRTDGQVAIPEGDLTVRRVVHWDVPAGVLSSTPTEDREAGPTVDATGTVLVYSVGEPGADTELWMAERFQGASGPVWRRRRLAELSSRADEGGPCLTADGRRLYFASNRSGGHGGFDIYVAAREGQRFMKPLNLGPAVNSAGDDFDPAVAPDGRRLVFASNRIRPGGVPPSLYESRQTGDGWSSPVRIEALSSTRRDLAPAFGPDGRTLYFASDRAGGAGGLDLYRSLEFDGAWLPPEPVSGLNSETDESDPALSGEGFSIFFSRGPGELMVAHTRELYRWETESGRLLSAFGSLVLILLILLLVVYLARRWAEMGLLGRSVFASLILHALLFLYLGRVMVRGGVSVFEPRPDRYRIRLLPPRATARPGERAFERVRGDRLSIPRVARAPVPERAALTAPTPRIEARALIRGRTVEDRPALEAPRADAIEFRIPPRPDPLAPPPPGTRRKRPAPVVVEAAPGPVRLRESAREATARSPVRLHLAAPAPRTEHRILTARRLEAEPIETDVAAPRLSAAPERRGSERRTERIRLPRPASDPRRARTPERTRLAEAAAPMEVTGVPTSSAPVREAPVAKAEVPRTRTAPPRDRSLLGRADLAGPSPRAGLTAFHTPVPEAAAIRTGDRVALARPNTTRTFDPGARRTVPAPVARDAQDVSALPDPELPEPERAEDPNRTLARSEREPGPGASMGSRIAPATKDRPVAVSAPVVKSPRSPDRVPLERPVVRQRADPLRQPAPARRRDSPHRTPDAGVKDRAEPEARPLTVIAARETPVAAAWPALEPPGAPGGPEPPPAPSLLRAAEPPAEDARETPPRIPVPPAREHRPKREPVPLSSAPPLTRAGLARRRPADPVEGEATNLAAPPPTAPDVERRPVSPPELVPEAPAHPMLRRVEAPLASLGLELRRPRAASAEREASLYAHRTGEARLRALREHGGTAESERAVQRGLDYLASTQRSDGSWGNPRYRHEKYGQVQVGKTGLALLAFLGSGHTQRSKTRYSAAVKRAIGFLLEAQGGRNGHFGRGSAYSHGIATYALAEAHAMTRDPALRDPLKKAVNRILEAQVVDPQDHLKHGGWSYYYADENRTWDAWPRASVTAWQVMALKSAQIGGLDVPGEALSAARGYLRRSFDRKYGYFRYAHDPDRLRSTYRTLPGSTPASMFALLLLGEDPSSERVVAGRRFVMERLPLRYARAADDRFVIHAEGNIYFWYYATLALFTLRGEAWDAWNSRLRDLLVNAQQRNGSWTPISPYANYANDTRTDRSYTTALCVLILEVYYRYVTPLLTYRPETIEREEPPAARPTPRARLRVVAIRARSTATRVGLKLGDEIVRYAGERVLGTNHLRTLIDRHRESDAVALEVARGGRALQMTVPGGALGVTVEEDQG